LEFCPSKLGLSAVNGFGPGQSCLAPLSIKERDSSQLVGLDLICCGHVFRFGLGSGCRWCVTWRVAWIVSWIFFVVCVGCGWGEFRFRLVVFFGCVGFGLFVNVVVVFVVGMFLTVTCLVFFVFHKPQAWDWVINYWRSTSTTSTRRRWWLLLRRGVCDTSAVSGEQSSFGFLTESAFLRSFRKSRISTLHQK
jgi:hypothetical protein